MKKLREELDSLEDQIREEVKEAFSILTESRLLKGGYDLKINVDLDLIGGEDCTVVTYTVMVENRLQSVKGLEVKGEFKFSDPNTIYKEYIEQVIYQDIELTILKKALL